MSLLISNHVTAAYSGQVNSTLVAERDGRVVGKLDWVLFQEQPSISMIDVAEKRRGIATAMLQHLQRLHPAASIQWGHVTQQGEYLKEAVTFTIDNPSYRSHRDEKDIVDAKLASNLEAAERYRLNPTAANREIHDKNVGSWNALHDREYELDEALRGMSRTLTFIRGSGCPAELSLQAAAAIKDVEQNRALTP